MFRLTGTSIKKECYTHAKREGGLCITHSKLIMSAASRKEGRRKTE